MDLWNLDVIDQLLIILLGSLQSAPCIALLLKNKKKPNPHIGFVAQEIHLHFKGLAHMLDTNCLSSFPQQGGQDTGGTVSDSPNSPECGAATCLKSAC